MWYEDDPGEERISQLWRRLEDWGIPGVARTARPECGLYDNADTKTEYAAADPILCLYHHCLGELRCAHLMDWPPTWRQLPWQEENYHKRSVCDVYSGLFVQLFVHLITRCVRKHKIKSKYIFRINMFCNTFTKGSLQPWKFLYGFFKLFLMLSQFQSSLVLYVILAHYYHHTNTEDIRDDKKFSHLWGYSKPLHCCHCCLLLKQNWKMAMFVNCKVHSFDIRGCW